DVHALGPVSLTMQRGETVAIVGPSGCGKSTLLRIIAGLDDATAGTITVDGRRVVEPLDNVGIVFQRDLLLDWRNILDN
ncbi:ATP-binding cassette domain-containing protein, partial [Acinetobacter baumannii]